ncbi:hypothetical protein Tc00.1047053503717.15 [Trypanosoma cruzi]|uniref:Secreted protein n=1 Tax=Trypanosoma cruzi (strain CL Brener) TaxID=353153 RepID=Q4DE99_TRYCC|nr:hypothetical protein Tc00.1047053503717.15 [Trypanosoma cruzi]EAN90852.1 hypothetical protein Tc00.1047053503717.15 [Trypanosoma cruzi]|eukprot:XP_812703.1 hypothetical protein [Trypanosoma cruzi strain CL Brener]
MRMLFWRCAASEWCGISGVWDNCLLTLSQQPYLPTCHCSCGSGDEGFSGCVGCCAGALEETTAVRLAAAHGCCEGRRYSFAFRRLCFLRGRCSVCAEV